MWVEERDEKDAFEIGGKVGSGRLVVVVVVVEKVGR